MRKHTFRHGMFTVLATLAIIAPAFSGGAVYASTTPPGEDNRYHLTDSPKGGCTDSQGRSAGQYVQDCYLP